jgi:hypothetical protein
MFFKTIVSEVDPQGANTRVCCCACFLTEPIQKGAEASLRQNYFAEVE